MTNSARGVALSLHAEIVYSSRPLVGGGGTTALRRLYRPWAVVRYHRTGQLLRRLAKRITPSKLVNRPIILSEAPHPERWYRPPRSFVQTFWHEVEGRSAAEAARRVQDMEQVRFTLLNHSQDLGHPIDWHRRGELGTNRLWGFGLHYHEFLWDYAVVASCHSDGRQEASERMWRIVADWVERNELGHPAAADDAWHPYCISRRLRVWLLLLAALPPESELFGRIVRSSI